MLQTTSSYNPASLVSAPTAGWISPYESMRTSVLVLRMPLSNSWLIQIPQEEFIDQTYVQQIILPQRLVNPLYGRDILDLQLNEMAGAAPGIERVWEITKEWPSLTELLLEERNNE